MTTDLEIEPGPHMWEASASLQGATSLPNVVVIELLFLKIITNTCLTYLYPANIFFLVHFMDEKKPSAHMALRLTPQSIR